MMMTISWSSKTLNRFQLSQWKLKSVSKQLSLSHDPKELSVKSFALHHLATGYTQECVCVLSLMNSTHETAHRTRPPCENTDGKTRFHYHKISPWQQIKTSDQWLFIMNNSDEWLVFGNNSGMGDQWLVVMNSNDQWLVSMNNSIP